MASLAGALDILKEILEDMSSYKHIHNQDEKLLTSPLNALAKVGRRYLDEYHLDLNALLDHLMVEEILTVSGVNYRPPAMQQVGDMDSHLFFSKVGSRSNINFSVKRLIASQQTVQEGEPLDVPPL